MSSGCFIKSLMKGFAAKDKLEINSPEQQECGSRLPKIKRRGTNVIQMEGGIWKKVEYGTL